MNSANLEPQNDVENTIHLPPIEIHQVPIWVKGMVIVGLILFLVQLPSFKNSLNDTIMKKQAIKARKAGQYTEAITYFEELKQHYPNDKEIIKKLAFTQYEANQYIQSLRTFELLVGTEMPKSEIEKINQAISDMVSKIKDAQQQ